MSGILVGDLLAEMRSISAVLDVELQELAKYGRQKAEANAAYYAAKAKETIRLKADGYAATLIPLLVKGSSEVSRLMLEKDVAEVLHDATKESLMKHKMDYRTVSEQHAREWSQR